MSASDLPDDNLEWAICVAAHDPVAFGTLENLQTKQISKRSGYDRAVMGIWSVNDQIRRVMIGFRSVGRAMIGLCTSISGKSIFSLERESVSGESECEKKHLKKEST